MVIDTSAFLAILQDEPDRPSFTKAIAPATVRRTSAASFLEASIVLESRQGADGVRLLDLLIESAVPEPVRPPLKWVGGKRWQIQHLLKHWQPNKTKRLVEPFAGGLAVALGLMPGKALLNDINPHLVNFYKWLKKGLVIKGKLDHSEAGYYKARNRFNALLKSKAFNTAEAAALFYYLNRTGYNGLCRFNSSGGFNVPFGRYPKLKYKYDFSEYVSVFKAWRFSSVHFSRLKLADDDFVYADPPYDVEFTKYSKDGFSWADQIAVAEWLSRHKGPVILSNQATKRIKDEYDRLGFTLLEFDAPRKISCTGDRRPAVEVLAIRNLPV